MNNRKTFIAKIQQQVTLVGVSKNRTLDEIWELHNEGISVFGENRVQELSMKYDATQPWEWHFIGHLQKNKVSKLIKMVTMIHSVDSIELVNVIEKFAIKEGRVINILIQVNIIEEETKFGCSLSDVMNLVNHVQNCKFTKLRGFMIMGPTNQDPLITDYVFEKANDLFKRYKKTHPDIDTLSMGMSSDYNNAIKNGATMVRLGSVIFDYSKNAHPQ